MAMLFAHENFTQEVVDELRVLGHDVVTMVDVGLDNRSIPDPTVLLTRQV